jgi:hypothetical protein
MNPAEAWVVAIEDEGNTLETVPKVSEQEQIRYLRSKATNFVFLFGKPAIGKTAITASLIHYLNTECPHGNLEKRGNFKGQRVWDSIQLAIAEHRFPDRTGAGNVFEIESVFVPTKSRRFLSRLSLTFLDMGGESLWEVSSRQSGKLPAHIDIYFKAGSLSLTFILVTSPEEARADDQLMLNFLDYIGQKSSHFREAKALLLVAKWDTYTGGASVDEFLRFHMPSTYRRLTSSSNGYGPFSLGSIDEVDGQPYIQEYDSRPAKAVFQWLYRTLTGKQLN